MATCKDCIHQKVCVWHNELEDECNGNCADFKNKTDIVEVVRCHECEYYKPQTQSKHWQNAKKYCCRAATIKVNDFDFCSYGERK